MEMLVADDRLGYGADLDVRSKRISQARYHRRNHGRAMSSMRRPGLPKRSSLPAIRSQRTTGASRSTSPSSSSSSTQWTRSATHHLQV